MGENKEKKGDLLTQIAIIADLIEKINVISIENDLIIGLSEDEFKKVVEYFAKKDKSVVVKNIDNNFGVSIGELNVVFTSKSNV